MKLSPLEALNTMALRGPLSIGSPGAAGGLWGAAGQRQRSGRPRLPDRPRRHHARPSNAPAARVRKWPFLPPLPHEGGGRRSGSLHSPPRKGAGRYHCGGRGGVTGRGQAARSRPPSARGLSSTPLLSGLDPVPERVLPFWAFDFCV